MSENAESLPLSVDQELDEICDRFEVELKADRKPKIEDYLGQSTGKKRSALLSSLLEIELELLSRKGATPELESYQGRFSDQAAAVTAAFAKWSTRRNSTDTASLEGSPVETTSGEKQKPAAEPHPQQLGRFFIRKVLGEGAMGAVYLANDPKLDRMVALKVPKFNSKTGPEILERFQREARSAATLNHRNICQVFEIDEQDGQHFIAMAFVEGRPLSDYINLDKQIPQKTAVVLIRKLARALDHAHSNDVVHRDLKPANIMIDKEMEPVITDFGLACRTDDGQSRMTQSGTVLGTPAYMPLEQVKGEIDRIGPAADIYSLGVVFYELLTGELPFMGPVTAVIAQILTGEPTKPTQLNADIDPQLEAICLKAMAKQIEDRYSSMGEFAEVLSAYLRGGKQPAAKPPNAAAPEGRTAATADSTVGPVTEVIADAERRVRQPDAGSLGAGQREVEGEPSEEESMSETASFEPPKRQVPHNVGTSNEEPVRPGQVLGDCRILRALGRGGMGVVYLAEHVRLKDLRAVKILPRNKVTDDSIARFWKEAQRGARINHLNVVGIHDVGQEGDLHFIIMQYIDGRTLKEYLDRHLVRSQGKPLTWSTALRFAVPVLDALAAMHSLGLIHRDIKPSNIMVTDAVSRNNHVILMDFGLVHDSSDVGLTQLGRIVGTPAYMSKEHANGEKIDGRTDLYAVGATLYFLLTGNSPYKGTTLEVFHKAAAGDRPASLRQLRPDLPAAVCRIIERAMEPDRERRYSRAADMMKEIVVVGEFWIDKYEVTNGEYAKFIQATKRSPPPHWTGGNPPSELVKHPVTQVSYLDAAAYAEWAGKKLPTIAQWTRAFRGDDERMYPWGDEWDFTRTNVSQNLSFETGTSPVESTPLDVSPFGVFNLVGNVDEILRERRIEQGQPAAITKGAHSESLGDFYGAAPFQYRWVGEGPINKLTGFRCVSEGD